MKKNIFLSVRGIKKNYKNKKILKGVDFDIYHNEILSFIALNGQGKTTMLKILCNITYQDSGSIEVFSKASEKIFIPELPYFIEEFTGLECVEYMLSLEKVKIDRELIIDTFKKIELPVSKEIVKNYSKGMRQKLGIVSAYHSKADFIALDEPYSGLDLKGQHILKKFIKELREKGKTIFFSSHNLEFVYELSDRFILLHDGKIVEEKRLSQFDSFEKLRDNFIKMVGEL